MARLPLSHTVKELVSRGLKSRSGGFTEVSTAIDILSLGRPPSWRRAEPIPARRRRSIHFVMFFEDFFTDISQLADYEVNRLKNSAPNTHFWRLSHPWFFKCAANFAASGDQSRSRARCFQVPTAYLRGQTIRCGQASSKRFLLRRIVTTKPPAGGSETTFWPPHASTAAYTIASPRPLPPVSPLRDRSGR